MFGSNISETKEKIYRAAATLFSKQGYDNVSMRNLAKAVGIRNSSIYNHFESKNDILLGLYEAYAEQRKQLVPDLEELLELAKVMPPTDILLLLNKPFPADIAEITYSILITAARSISTDASSRKFMADNLFSLPKTQMLPVLSKLIELGRIEPIDPEVFDAIMRYFCFGAIILYDTPFGIDISAWEKGLRHLYMSVIKPTGK